MGIGNDVGAVVSCPGWPLNEELGAEAGMVGFPLDAGATTGLNAC